MALPFRIRRAIPFSSSLINRLTSTSSFSFSKSKPVIAPTPNPTFIVQSQSFKSSSILGNYKGGGIDDDTKIGPDDILFEGCDYNHWLITINFPKVPAPTPEEMVETYVQTAAQVFGSVEEAKKRIYACSTSTYNGFQVACDEATSEKFRGLPGIVFILPDSYIDPVNKQYGGDKYENGVITPRPPPMQYFRGARDRNRNNDQQRYGSRDQSLGGGGYRGPSPQGGGSYGGPPPQSGGYGGPPQSGSYRGPQPQSGGYGGPPQSGSYRGPQPQSGGYGGPLQSGGYRGPPPQQGGGSYRGMPPQGGGYGSPPRSQNGGNNYGNATGFNQGQHQGYFVPQEQRNFVQGMGGNYNQPSPGYTGSSPTQGSSVNGPSSSGSDERH